MAQGCPRGALAARTMWPRILPTVPALSRLRQPAHSVRGPGLAAHAVVAEEKPVRIVLALDLQEALVVVAPESPLPVGLEIVRFVDVGPGARRHGPDRVHRRSDACLRRLTLGAIGLLPRYTRNCIAAGGRNDQRSRVEHLRVHRRFAATLDRLRRGAGLSLVEVQRD